MPPPPHVLVATPCFDGMVSQRHVVSAIDLLQRGASVGVKVSLDLPGFKSLITRWRNIRASSFLDHPTTTRLLFIDTKTR